MCVSTDATLIESWEDGVRPSHVLAEDGEDASSTIAAALLFNVPLVRKSWYAHNLVFSHTHTPNMPSLLSFDVGP